MSVDRDPHEAAAVLSAGKALTILEVLLQTADPLSAREIGERCSVNRTTVHRLLNTLMLHGWVERHVEGGYRLSVKFLALARVSEQVRGFFDEIRPALVPLSQRSRETVHVGVLDGFDVVHVDKIESLEHVGVSSRIGSRGVTHRTGLGKALLAASTDEYITDYITRGRRRATPYRVEAVEVDTIWASVAETRERGYSIDDEDDSVGVRCLGAAIRGTGGNPVFAISLTGPSPRFTRAKCEELGPVVVQVARELTLRLGGSMPEQAAARRGEGA